MVVVTGVPFDEASSFQRGAAAAPRHIRETLHSPATNLCTEGGIDLGTDTRWKDVGDLELPSGAEVHGAIESGISRLLGGDARVVSLGGDHSITWPILHAFSRKHPRLSVLHIDAHPDLYDEFEGNRNSHACAFARIMEDKLATRLVQVGIRTATPHQREQAARFGVETVPMRDWRRNWRPDFDDPVYVSLDLDALDPAFAPGVSHPEPGGFSTSEIVDLLLRLQVPVVGADIVELNPSRDPSGITAAAAAKLLKEILALVLES